MNPKIRELAENDLIQSEYTEFGWQECHYYQFDPDELQKFAELIIKQCCDIIQEYESPHCYVDDMINDIMNQFGVN